MYVPIVHGYLPEINVFVFVTCHTVDCYNLLRAFYKIHLLETHNCETRLYLEDGSSLAWSVATITLCQMYKNVIIN